MNTLTEIEAAIKKLPENDARQLAASLQAYLNDMWDEQIKADFMSGKLDKLIAKAEADIAANRIKDLDEVLNDD